MFKHAAVSLLCVAALGATATPAALAAHKVGKPTTVAPAHKVGVQHMQGGSTGTGPATDDDCQTIADVIGNRLSWANSLLVSDDPEDVAEGAQALDEANNYEQQGYNAGCFFVY